MDRPQKILITGASGFIGSFLVEKALDAGFDVWAGIRKGSNRGYLQDKRIRFIDLNFNQKEALTDQLKTFSEKYGKFDYVVHNAGITKCLNKEDFNKINFLNTANLIDALIAADCIPQKFALMSSLSVMGSGDEVDYTPFSLNDTPNPNTAYGKSKQQAEEYLRIQKNFPYMIFRPTGVYGPREKDYYLMLKTVKSGLDVGAGFKPQHLTFIYVKDLVNAIFLGIESDLKNKTYFVADGDVYTDKEYTNIIKDCLSKKRVLNIKVPLWLLKIISLIAEGISSITGKASTLNGDKYIIMKQRNWECDIQSLINELGFSPQYNLSQGLKESIDWYKKNGWL